VSGWYAFDTIQAMLYEWTQSRLCTCVFSVLQCVAVCCSVIYTYMHTYIYVPHMYSVIYTCMHIYIYMYRICILCAVFPFVGEIARCC